MNNLPSNHSVSSQKSYNELSSHSQQTNMYGPPYPGPGIQKAGINVSMGYPAQQGPIPNQQNQITGPSPPVFIPAQTLNSQSATEYVINQMNSGSQFPQHAKLKDGTYAKHVIG
jgi:hypothetical protein